MDSMKPKNISKPKSNPYPDIIEDINKEGGQPHVELMDIEVEPLQATNIPQPSPVRQKERISNQSSTRVTRSQKFAR